MKNTKYYLSDPWGDFQDEEGQGWLRNVISKKGKGLTACDFICIFQNYLPAGTYEECLCYLPHVFDYLKTPDSKVAQVLHHLMWFISEYETSLKNDGKSSYIWEHLINILNRSCLFDVFNQPDLLRSVTSASHLITSLLEYSYGQNLWRYLERADAVWQKELSYNFVIICLTIDEPWMYDNEKYNASKLWKNFYSGSRLKRAADSCLKNLHLFKKTSYPISVQRFYLNEFKILLRSCINK